MDRRAGKAVVPLPGLQRRPHAAGDCWTNEGARPRRSSPIPSGAAISRCSSAWTTRSAGSWPISAKPATDKNTLIFFFSDNGGSGRKPFLAYNTAVNTPAARQQGPDARRRHPRAVLRLLAGQAAGGQDLRPARDRAGHPADRLRGGRREDAEQHRWREPSAVPHRREKRRAPHEALYWRFGPQKAIRKGDWKLVDWRDFETKTEQRLAALRPGERHRRKERPRRQAPANRRRAEPAPGSAGTRKTSPRSGTAAPPKTPPRRRRRNSAYRNAEGVRGLIRSIRNGVCVRTAHAFGVAAKREGIIMRISCALFVLAIAPAIAFAQPPISIERIRGDIKYLSSDPLQGRGVGSRGEDLAVDFIAQQFEKAGLKPAGERGTFFQAVPLVMVTTGPNATLALSQGRRNDQVQARGRIRRRQQNRSNRKISTPRRSSSATASPRPSSAGTITQDVDVKGKVVVVFTNEPPSDDPKFFARQGAHLLWPLDLQVRGGDAPRRQGGAHHPHQRDRRLSLLGRQEAQRGPDPAREGQPALAFAGWLSARARRQVARLGRA